MICEEQNGTRITLTATMFDISIGGTVYSICAAKLWQPDNMGMDFHPGISASVHGRIAITQTPDTAISDIIFVPHLGHGRVSPPKKPSLPKRFRH
jgi:hypothetical protein